ncbi:hypothetical protein KQX54_011399 [Cotesia glomerata]|uniref:Uncharacterized protein n=1 Tax=Cotesia glomerata TaxID=32391 RepID=A0AAV7J4Q3_COTGL|nr:hypothetical protein KQX54_011399 [Cotesia glomerata]
MDLLLNSWNLGKLYPIFITNDITDLDTLKEFIENSNDEIKREVLKSIGLLLRLKKKFRDHSEKLSDPGSEFQDTDTKPTLGITDANFESSAGSSSLHTDNASIVTSIDISDLPVISETDLQEPEQLLIVNSTSTSKRDSKLVNFDLRKILEDHPIGRALLRTALSNIPLEAQWQSYLCEIIVIHFLKSKKELVNDDFDKISKKIVEIFPNQCTQIYYVPTVKKTYSKRIKSEISKEKLVDKWRNINTIIRSLENLTVNILKDHIDEPQTSSPLASKQWLVNNREDADVLIHWDLSYDLRREEVENKKYLSAIDIFNDWPILKETIGSKLVNVMSKNFLGDSN